MIVNKIDLNLQFAPLFAFSCILPETNVIYCRLPLIPRKKAGIITLVVSYPAVGTMWGYLPCDRFQNAEQSTVISTKCLIERCAVTQKAFPSGLQPRQKHSIQIRKASLSMQRNQNLLFRNNAVLYTFLSSSIISQCWTVSFRATNSPSEAKKHIFFLFCIDWLHDRGRRGSRKNVQNRKLHKR